ncbi:MAG TPA: DinB family protein [Thermoanaerobaculia bacterium]|jgi:uncharacterized damage-inducible protein DinB|nr:DinB family protein [Thermoanaerobaculia bacterium]
MKRWLYCCAALAVVALMAQPLTAAEAAKPAAAEHAAPMHAAEAPMSIRGEILRQIDAARDKLLALAEATPADKFTWRPNDKVRTVGEVYAHVAGGNFFIPTLWGAKMPDGVDPRAFDKDAGDKAKTIATLKASFENVHKAIEGAADADLHKPVKIFAQEGTEIQAMMMLVSHGHEHLGQSIAYARSIGIVPPWSQ